MIGYDVLDSSTLSSTSLTHDIFSVGEFTNYINRDEWSKHHVPKGLTFPPLLLSASFFSLAFTFSMLGSSQLVMLIYTGPSSCPSSAPATPHYSFIYGIPQPFCSFYQSRFNVVPSQSSTFDPYRSSMSIWNDHARGLSLLPLDIWEMNITIDVAIAPTMVDN